ncbi:MAG: anaerobic ribonucleoside-triphosphate reductase activating protein, partial [Clostridia bacterium]|nr:anaerobic ribonucleoside-triphosphate reductase activating protein [Clostridia bacterium]
MKLFGIEKYSLVDYDGYVACTVFTGGCNFRCPFCHNAALVTGIADCPTISEEEVFDYIRSRRGLVDALAITGGEPTLHRDLPLFIHRARELGVRIKLDTNGTNPEMLKGLIEAGLVDYVAMDIKNVPAKYPLTAGVEMDLAPIQASIDILKEGKVDYEFRTTIVEGHHTVEDVEEIARWIAPSSQYYLQCFADKGGNLQE